MQYVWENPSEFQIHLGFNVSALSSGPGCLIFFSVNILLLLTFHMSSEGSEETAHLRSLL